MSKRKINQISSDIKYDLHDHGFTIHSSAIKLDNTYNSIIKTYGKKFRPIFNNTGNNDKQRKQCKISYNKYPFLTRFKNFLNLNYFELTCNEWNVLYSSSKCKEQSPHCDYIPDIHLSRVRDDEFPLSAILALMPNTKICVWPKSIRLAYLNQSFIKHVESIYKKELYLNPGDIFVFRGDLVHAGSQYEEENIRIHVYLDSNKVPRIKNRTWLIQKNGDTELQRIIK